MHVSPSLPLSLSLCMHVSPSLPFSLSPSQAIVLLGRFISVREPNIRYLGLETMTRFAHMHMDDTADVVKKHQATILQSLKDVDIRQE